MKLRRWNARGDPIPVKKKLHIPGSLSLSLSSNRGERARGEPVAGGSNHTKSKFGGRFPIRDDVNLSRVSAPLATRRASAPPTQRPRHPASVLPSGICPAIRRTPCHPVHIPITQPSCHPMSIPSVLPSPPSTAVLPSVCPTTWHTSCYPAMARILHLAPTTQCLSCWRVSCHLACVASIMTGKLPKNSLEILLIFLYLAYMQYKLLQEVRTCASAVPYRSNSAAALLKVTACQPVQMCQPPKKFLEFMSIFLYLVYVQYNLLKKS